MRGSIGYWRAGLLVAGVVAGLYGAWLEVTRLETADIVDAVKWLVGGVVAHDAIVSFAIAAIGVVAVRLVPAVARTPLVVAAIVVGTLSVVAFPMLAGFGAEESNPTLLDRDYWLGWWGLVAAAALGVVVATVVRARRGAAARSATASQRAD